MVICLKVLDNKCFVRLYFIIVLLHTKGVTQI